MISAIKKLLEKDDFRRIPEINYGVFNLLDKGYVKLFSRKISDCIAILDLTEYLIFPDYIYFPKSNKEHVVFIYKELKVNDRFYSIKL